MNLNWSSNSWMSHLRTKMKILKTRLNCWSCPDVYDLDPIDLDLGPGPVLMIFLYLYPFYACPVMNLGLNWSFGDLA